MMVSTSNLLFPVYVIRGELLVSGRVECMTMLMAQQLKKHVNMTRVTAIHTLEERHVIKILLKHN